MKDIVNDDNICNNKNEDNDHFHPMLKLIDSSNGLAEFIQPDAICNEIKGANGDFYIN